jgi:hypothetical protein
MQCILRFLTAVSLVITLSLSAAAATGDWPQWRGPNRDGLSPDKGLLKQWPEGGPKLVWKASGVGIGYTGVSIVGDQVFLMGDVDGASYLMALNRADGKIQWNCVPMRPAARRCGARTTPRISAESCRNGVSAECPSWMATT